MCRCPHRSTARRPASWTTSSCCSPAPWRPSTNFDAPIPASHWPSRRSCADAPEVELVDPEGLPLARLEAHGRSPRWPAPAYGAFRRLHLTPAQAIRRSTASADRRGRRPRSTERDLEEIRKHADGRGVVLLALIGTGTPQDVSPVGLVRVTLVAADLLARHRHRAEVVRQCPVPTTGSPPRRRRTPSQVDRTPTPARWPRPTTSDGRPGTAASGPSRIAAIVAQDQPGDDERGFVVFFTGLSGSGKSTLARALHDLILEDGRRTVTSLDGDVVRRHLSAGLTFSREDRETNIRRIGWVAAEIARHRGIAICSPIAPFDETRKQVRADGRGGRR